MKLKNTRGITIPTHIIISAVLLVLQLAFLGYVLYNISLASTAVYALTMLFAVITVIYILNGHSNPDHKIAWIIFILIFPVFGVTMFFLWGGGNQPNRLKNRMSACEKRYGAVFKDDSAVFDRLKYYDLMHARQAEYLKLESGSPLYDSSETEFLKSGEIFFEKLLEELQKAEKYIFIEFFILAEGEMWDQIYEILKAKVKAGLEIKIIFDDFGSIKRQRKGFVKKLRNEGIKVSVFNPIIPTLNIFMNNRNHRKIVVIDGNTAFTGGINIGDEYINAKERFGHWADCGVMVKGPAVTSFVAMFCTMWEFITHKKIDIECHMGSYECMAEGFVLPYSDGPLNQNNPAEGIYLQMINTAQHYVYITTPYLIIDNIMKSALIMAAKSGIDVRIILPHIPDKWYVHPATRYNYLELLRAGVKIYEYTPGFIHSKCFVSDDTVATVGTVNMDYRSFVFHFECGVWLSGSESVLQIKEYFKETEIVSEEILLAKWRKRPVLQRLKEAVLHVFAPFM